MEPDEAIEEQGRKARNLIEAGIAPECWVTLACVGVVPHYVSSNRQGLLAAFTGGYGTKMEFLSARFQDVSWACRGEQFRLPHRQLSLSGLGYGVNDNP